jgi:5-methylcytosine-specific restriction endonuclease McrA
MSTTRRKTAGYPKDAEGKTLCRCGCNRYPQHPRINWFEQKCVDRYMSKTDTKTIRRLLLHRDKGICAVCGIDCEKVFKEEKATYYQASKLLHWLEHAEEDRLRRHFGIPITFRDAIKRMMWPDTHNRKGWLLLDKHNKARRVEIFRLAGIEDRRWRFDRYSGWDADHIIPVCEGGGECEFENYRTLCHSCHYDVTAELARRRNKCKTFTGLPATA